ncbi:glycosyltransferase [Maritimibacter sp. HL-12]|uniref:glycosyltransferase n=1 Tax=Maritimibacter sp. HL-12 TaxID=1162418 RepID=UPI000A0F0090|nr:glycosyltransferase [Maritimibacter sp. HL-12]SMH40765.1 sterol 3beta-glucosyltransferase [Maritimibacter sp. HL-12]
MNILILSYGTRGDVQPYVALGRGLKARGHVVTIATAARFAGFVTGHGLRFAPLSDALLAVLDTPRGRKMIENSENALQSLVRMVSMLWRVGPMQREIIEDCWAAAESAEPDLILFHPKAYAAPAIAEKCGVPVVLALLLPLLVPTASAPMMSFPDLRIGWWNRATYRMASGLLGRSARNFVRATRASHGLPDQRRFDLMRASSGQPIPVLHAVSPRVLPAPSDWPDWARMSGYWFLDEEDRTPPPELAAFLAAGPPPVYVGFGSMAGRSPERLARTVVEGLGQAGVRGILATGWGGLEPGDLPDTIIQIDTAPHDWLFPRMAAVVHHGGAGTTAAAIRAGRPQVVVPFFGDQPWWGAKVHRLGLGPPPIPQKKLTAQGFAAALRQATTDKEIAAAANRLGTAIRAEDGIARAIEDIEALTGLALAARADDPGR